MKYVSTLTVLATALFAAASASAFDVPELIRGPLPPDLRAHLLSTIKVATCPAGYIEKFANQKLSCERTVRQTANIQCSTAFPNYVARSAPTGSDRDLCVKNGIVITSNGPLTGLTAGVDFVNVPSNGVIGSTSYVAGVANASTVTAEGWSLDVPTSSAVDRYRRSFVVKATPILVNP